MEAKNLHLGLLIAILVIIVTMASFPIAVADVTWSDEAELYRDVVWPCIWNQWPKPPCIFPDPICLWLAGAENIAAGTDMVVDVDDLRAAMMAFHYNQEYVAGDTLAAMCYFQNGLELGLFNPLPGRDPPVNCLEGTGIPPVDCTALATWMMENADVINTAMESACAYCDVTWNPDRPVVSEFPSFLILPLFMVATLLVVIAYRRKHSVEC